MRGFRKVCLLILGAVGFVFMVCLLLQSGAMALHRNGKEPVTEKKAVSFPMEIPGTTLVAQRLISYETDREMPVAAIELENTGAGEVACARVILYWDKGAYVFDVDQLPSGAATVVPERDLQPYGIYFWTDCRGVQKSDLNG